VGIKTSALSTEPRSAGKDLEGRFIEYYSSNLASA
jgi:hypothetical protein